MFFLGISTIAEHTEIALIEARNPTAKNQKTPAKAPAKASPKAKILLEKSWGSLYNESEKIFPVLQRALAKLPKTANPTPDSTATNLRIFVVEGPGPFTGLRIGVTIANTLAFAYSAPMLSMTTFEYLRAKLPAARKNDTAIVLKGGSFFAVVTPGSSKPSHVKPHEVGQFLAKKKNVQYYAGDTPPKAEPTARTQAAKLPPRVTPSRMHSLSRVLTELAEASTNVTNATNITNVGPKLKTHKLIHPYYLAPPHITKSKKPVFVKK